MRCREKGLLPPGAGGWTIVTPVYWALFTEHERLDMIERGVWKEVLQPSEEGVDAVTPETKGAGIPPMQDPAPELGWLGVALSALPRSIGPPGQWTVCCSVRGPGAVQGEEQGGAGPKLDSPVTPSITPFIALSWGLEGVRGFCLPRVAGSHPTSFLLCPSGVYRAAPHGNMGSVL